MKIRLGIFFVHFLWWLVFSLAYLFLSESVTKLLFPGIYDVGIWLNVLAAGLLWIFVCTVISCIYRMRKLKKNVTGRQS